MILTGFLPALVAAFIACALADWIFMGVLFHARYQAHPEVRRASGTSAAGQRRVALAVSLLLNLVSCAALLFATGFLGLTSTSLAVTLAVVMWLAVALPILVNWGMFAKIHVLVIAAHTIGWLVKLLAIAFIAVQFL